MLAEDFRTYMKSPKAKKGSPKRNTIFRKILNFLKALFGITPRVAGLSKEAVVDIMNVKQVRELYQKLYASSTDPSYLNTYSPSMDNIIFFDLQRGIRSVNDSRKDVLTEEDSNLLAESMLTLSSNITDEFIDKGQPKGIVLSIPNDKANRVLMLKKLRAKLNNKLEKLKESIKPLYEDKTPFKDINTVEKLDLQAAAIIKGKKRRR